MNFSLEPAQNWSNPGTLVSCPRKAIKIPFFGLHFLPHYQSLSYIHQTTSFVHFFIRFIGFLSDPLHVCFAKYRRVSFVFVFCIFLVSPSFLSLFHCFFFSRWVFLSLVFLQFSCVVIEVVEKKSFVDLWVWHIGMSVVCLHVEYSSLLLFTICSVAMAVSHKLCLVSNWNCN